MNLRPLRGGFPLPIRDLDLLVGEADAAMPISCSAIPTTGVWAMSGLTRGNASPAPPSTAWRVRAWLHRRTCSILAPGPLPPLRRPLLTGEYAWLPQVTSVLPRCRNSHHRSLGASPCPRCSSGLATHGDRRQWHLGSGPHDQLVTESSGRAPWRSASTSYNQAGDRRPCALRPSSWPSTSSASPARPDQGQLRYPSGDEPTGSANPGLLR